METVTLKANDISCDHCINAIKGAVTALPGVSFLGGDPVTKRVTVQYDPAQADLDKIKAAMDEEGYPVGG